jgi:serine/threonine protein kinase|tara:strand:- start:2600 stop:6757 length:4158 start_codon:yes stop_codon:yes gene_type:complete
MLAYAELEEGLIEDLDVDPSSHEEYLSALQQLVGQEVISQEVFSDLMAAIETVSSGEEEFEQAEDESEQAEEEFEQAEEEIEEAQEELEPPSDDTVLARDDIEEAEDELEPPSDDTVLVRDDTEEAEDELGSTTDDTVLAQDDIEEADDELGPISDDTVMARDDIEKAEDELGPISDDTVLARDDIEEAEDDLGPISDDTAEDELGPISDDTAEEELGPVSDDTVLARVDAEEPLDRAALASDETVLTGDSAAEKQEELEETQEDSLRVERTPSAPPSKWSEPSEDEGAVSIGTVLQNRFRITELIGHGGTGSVYKAQDQLMVDAKEKSTEIAVKVLNKSFHEHPEAFQILHREALKTRSLAHPHIVNVFDCDRDENTIFMTMELMHGLRLDDALDVNPDGFEFENAKRYIVEMADALQNAHRGGVIHSDLRPGNIYLASGKVKLFDFGMAKAIQIGGAETTRRESYKPGDVDALTPAYASPEALENSAEPDPRDDIFAMGCLSYEMLTGRHPFVEDGVKVPANIARKKGLKPARISRLKSWQWNALKGCLEFERSKRTIEVDIFLEQFLQQSRAVDLRKLTAAAAVVVLIPSLAFVGWQYVKQRDIGEFNVLVNQGVEHELIQLRIRDVQKMNAEDQFAYFHAPMSQNDLMNYYQRRSDDLIARDDFELAQPLIDQATALYPDSSRVNTLLNDFNAKRNRRINDLDGKLNSLLADPADFSSRYLELEEIWQTFAKVDDDYPTDISARSVILNLEDTASRLMSDGDNEAATDMVQFGVALFAGDPEMQAQLAALKNMTGIIESEEGRQQRSQLLAEVESTLNGLGQDSSLAELQAAREQIVTLSGLSPDSEVLLRIRSMVKDRLNEVIEQELTTQQWQKAQSHIEPFAEALSVKERELLEANIDSRRTAYQERAAELVRSITRAARSDDPGSAIGFLDQLKDFDPDSPEIAASAELIGTGWLKQARIQKVNEAWQSAQSYVQNGLKIAEGDDLRKALQNELVDIDRSKERAGKQLELAEATRRQQQKRQRVQQVEEAARTAISDNPLTSAGSMAALDLLDQLEIEDPSNALIDSGKKQLVQRYQEETRRLSGENKLEQALQISQLGFNLLPDQAVLAAGIEEVKGLITAQQVADQQQQLAQLQDELTRLSEKFDLTTDPDHLVETLQRYEASHESDGLSEYVRFKAAAAFVKLADAHIEGARFADAKEAISEARRFDPDYAQIRLVEEKVRREDLQNQSARKDQRLQARLASLQQSFITQVQALDVRSAATTLDAVKKGSLPSTDAFFAVTVPTEFERAYLRLAALKASPSTLTETIALLETGLGYKADSNLLQTRLDIYRQAQRIVTTGQSNPEQSSRLLARAQRQYPKEEIFQNLKTATTRSR